MQTASQAPRKREFHIENGADEVVVKGRNAAIERARTMSKRTWRPVYVERADKRVALTYKRGKLQQYAFTTRDRLRR